MTRQGDDEREREDFQGCGGRGGRGRSRGRRSRLQIELEKLREEEAAKRAEAEALRRVVRGKARTVVQLFREEVARDQERRRRLPNFPHGRPLMELIEGAQNDPEYRVILEGMRDSYSDYSDEEATEEELRILAWVRWDRRQHEAEEEEEEGGESDEADVPSGMKKGDGNDDGNGPSGAGVCVS